MLLSVKGVAKAFPGVQALDGVSLELAAGEVHGLMGENGAGKSTLIKIITGLHRPDTGTVAVDGREVQFHSPRDALIAGIGAVHQERNLIPRFSVGENIMLERLPVRGGLIDYARVHEEAARWLQRLRLDIDPRTPVHRLSVARMQIVEIAKALALRSRILLLDEPTASISEHEAEILFSLLRDLRREGVGMIFVSHKLEEVLGLCDRVTVLRDGRLAAAGETAAGLSRGRLVSLMIGRDERVPDFGARRPDLTQPALELQGLATAHGHRDITLTVHKGEIVGLYGLVGAGRSELARSIIGADRVTGGEIRVAGRAVRITSPRAALKQHRIGYVSEDRKQEGLILMHGVARNIAITIWDRIAGALGLLGRRREYGAVRPFVERLRVRTPSLDQRVVNLSGGNQQKVSVAKWLAAQARILIVDEPTVGIDVNTKTYLHELLWQLAGEGQAILLITSDMPEMVGLADRILVMSGMRLLGEVPNTRNYDAVSQGIMALIHEAAPEQDPTPA